MTKGWSSTQNPTLARKPPSKILLIVSQSWDPRSGMRRSSVRFVLFIFHPSVGRDPIHFSSPAPVIREGLLPRARIRSDVGDKIQVRPAGLRIVEAGVQTFGGTC